MSKEKSFSLDALGLEIIRHLRDGRKPFTEIAKALEVTENTVRARVNKLLDNDILSIEGRVDPFKISGHFFVMIGVKLDTVNLVPKGEEFAKLRGVVSVAVVTGQFDLIATVLLNDEFSIKEFYLEEVSKLSGLQSTETWVIYHNINTTVPYIL
jgi:Lrp/AsnC family transcriptional regulator for asnA, asnC and gidA